MNRASSPCSGCICRPRDTPAAQEPANIGLLNWLTAGYLSIYITFMKAPTCGDNAHESSKNIMF